MTPNKPPWIISARFDGGFILAPPLAVSLLVLISSERLESLQALPPWLWLLLIVGIDAGHVYATLFRTYLVKSELKQRQALLTGLPVIAWLVGCLLYSLGSLWFWRTLAYLAVFHFVRQQYGFMMIYARSERHPLKFYRNLDKTVIYFSTLFPLIYWHCRERRFNWFVENDFVRIDSGWLWQCAAVIYTAVIVAYIIKEMKLWRQNRQLNIPKNLFLLGTALSWHVGIVAFDNDLIFTATNVITHGVPYYALIWAYGYKQSRTVANGFIHPLFRALFSLKAIPLYLAALFFLAFLEEGLWDGMVWRENGALFILFNYLPAIEANQALTWLIPLLALPQATHYLLDAFIWRLNQSHTGWSQILFHELEKKPALEEIKPPEQGWPKRSG